MDDGASNMRTRDEIIASKEYQDIRRRLGLESDSEPSIWIRFIGLIARMSFRR